MRIMRKRKQQQGFTLAEVLIVIVIIGALAAIGFPALINFMPGFQLRAGGQDVFRAIQAAKAEASKRNKKVILDFPVADCSDNSIVYAKPYKACEYEKVKGGTSENILTDTDPCSGAKYAVDDGKKKYYAESLMPRNVAVCSDSHMPTSNKARIVFQPTGLLYVGPQGKEPSGPFYLHLKHTSKKREMYVQVERSGAVRVLDKDQKPN